VTSDKMAINPFSERKVTLACSFISSSIDSRRTTGPVDAEIIYIEDLLFPLLSRRHSLCLLAPLPPVSLPIPLLFYCHIFNDCRWSSQVPHSPCHLKAYSHCHLYPCARRFLLIGPALGRQHRHRVDSSTPAQGIGDTGYGWKPVADMFRKDSGLHHVKWILPHS
jgi:hypothetical protein